MWGFFYILTQNELSLQLLHNPKASQMRTITKAILLILLSFAGIAIQAQNKPIILGIKGSVNVSNWNGGIEDSKAKFGFNAGVTLDYLFTEELQLMTGLELMTKGAKDLELKQTAPSGGDNIFKYKGSQNAMYIQLPLRIGYRMNMSESTRIVLYAGPYFAYGIGGKVKFDNNLTLTSPGGSTEVISFDNASNPMRANGTEYDTFGENGYKKFDFGLGAGVGAEFEHLSLYLGFDYGVLNISQTDLYKARTMNAHLSLGYKF